MCFAILCEIFLFYEELSEIGSQMYVGLHVNYPLLLLNFNET